MCFCSWACSSANKAREPQVFFVAPKDGAEINSPVKMVFGVRGLRVSPAGKMDSGVRAPSCNCRRKSD